MPIPLETAEIQLDTVGAEAVQQTLDALGLEVEQVNAAAGDGTAGPEGASAVPGHDRAANSPSTESDLAGVLAALDRQTEILERIAATLEGHHSTSTPTY